MAYGSFADFLKSLEKAGELLRFKEPLATELEITALADREMKSKNGGRALLIERPMVNGKPSSFPLAINALGSHRRMALSFQAQSIEAVAQELGALIKAKPPTRMREAVKLFSMALELRHAKPKKVKSGICQEVIHRFDESSKSASSSSKSESSKSKLSKSSSSKSDSDSDSAKLSKSDLESDSSLSSFEIFESDDLPTLLDMPILKCWPRDGGRFITLPCVVTKDPENGERNVGMYRIQIYDSQTTGMHWQLQKVAARHGRSYYQSGRKMPVSIFLGGDPAYPFCATAPLPDGLDEFLLAGYLRRKSVELVKCLTNDLEVPANADFVIEGYIDPNEPLRDEGPFGDHTGFYTAKEPYPVFHITAITHRKDAIYPATIVGKPPMEDFYLGAASVRLFLPIFQMNFPEIVDMALPAEGVFHNLVFVSIRKTYPMQAYKIMHGLWGMGQMMFSKYIIVVDANINVHDTSEVLFQLCANTDPKRDAIITKGPSDVLDHATDVIGIGSKMGLDATAKMAGEGFVREWPPPIKMDDAVMEKIDRLYASLN